MSGRSPSARHERYNHAQSGVVCNSEAVKQLWRAPTVPQGIAVLVAGALVVAALRLVAKAVGGEILLLTTTFVGVVIFAFAMVLIVRAGSQADTKRHTR